MAASSYPAHNGQVFLLSDIPILPVEAWHEHVCRQTADGMRLSALCCIPLKNDRHLLIAVLADEKKGLLHVSGTEVKKEYPALTPLCLQAHLFEREIFETYGVLPQGHPWLKPVRFPLNGFHPDKQIGVMDFYPVKGEEIHEVAVGPVHAGVIEPGHFRFQCHGETVLHLEISLGYQHRGIEEALLQATPARQLCLIETASGDTTAGHCIAYSKALESLSGYSASLHAQTIRGLALELERIACHIGDIGALAGDVGFLPTAAFCGRIRGDVLNMTAELCGNRFSRGLIRPGGVAFDLDNKIRDRLLAQLEMVRRDTRDAIELFFDTPSVLARLEHTGAVSRKTAEEIGLVGPAARACGLSRDVRHDLPWGIYQYHNIPIAVTGSGDVMARAVVRWLEIQRSFTFVQEILQYIIESGSVEQTYSGKLQTNSMVISLTEAWRGEICHVAVTGADGSLGCYKIIDPSFHNWFGLACALRNEEISDFPLCNKSFNLSYCGFDL